MVIQIFSYSEKRIKAEDVMKLYKNADWWNERDESDIAMMLKSQISVGAWNGETLIGFSRAVTDNRFRAYVEDVVIHSDWRNKGVGKKLVSRLLEELDDIDIISLFCEESLIPFYEKSGFKYSKSQFVLHRKS